MSKRRIGTIVLTGTNAVEFANSIYRPTKKEIKNQSHILDKINSNITITEDSQGFVAEIDDLELSTDLLNRKTMNIWL